MYALCGEDLLSGQRAGAIRMSGRQRPFLVANERQRELNGREKDGTFDRTADKTPGEFRLETSEKRVTSTMSVREITRESRAR